MVKAKTIFAGSPEAKNFLAEVLVKSRAGAFDVPAKIVFAFIVRDESISN